MWICNTERFPWRGGGGFKGIPAQMTGQQGQKFWQRRLRLHRPASGTRRCPAPHRPAAWGACPHRRMPSQVGTGTHHLPAASPASIRIGLQGQQVAVSIGSAPLVSETVGEKTVASQEARCYSYINVADMYSTSSNIKQYSTEFRVLSGMVSQATVVWVC